MAINVLSKLFQEITKDSLVGFDMDFMEGMMEWNQNGGYKTIEEFGKLSKENCEAIIEYLEEFQLYAEVRVNNKNYVLVHGGLDNFDESKSLDDYSLDEIIWAETDYDKVYFKDKYLVTGHTPVQVIMSDKSYNKIYKKNNHIAIDCGCIYGGKLGVICLDTMEEMYF